MLVYCIARNPSWKKVPSRPVAATPDASPSVTMWPVASIVTVIPMEESCIIFAAEMNRVSFTPLSPSSGLFRVAVTLLMLPSISVSDALYAAIATPVAFSV